MEAPAPALSLSVLLPLIHPPVYTVNVLLLLDDALRQDGFTRDRAEAILAPASKSSTIIHTTALQRNYSSFVTMQLPAPPSPHAGVWHSKSCTSVPCDQELPLLFESLFSRHQGEVGVSAEQWSVPAAINRAARTARGRLLLLLDQRAEPHPGFFSPLQAAVATSGVGVAGGTLRDSSGRLHHGGYAIALGPIPRSGRFGGAYYGSRYDSYGGGGGGATSEVGVPYSRWSGLTYEGHGPRGTFVGGGEVVHGVSLGFSLIAAKLWRMLDGLNTSMPAKFAAVEFSLRAAEEASALTLYVNASSVQLASAPGGGDGERSESERSALSAFYDEALPAAWRGRWGPVLAEEVRARWRLNLTLIWNMECDVGPVRGFTDEAITFAVALEGLVDLRLEVSEPWRCDEAVLSSLPEVTREAIHRMQKRSLLRDGVVLIVHRDPGRCVAWP